MDMCPKSTDEREKDIDDLIIGKIDKRRERIKDKADSSAFDGAVTLRTRKVIFDMLSKGIIKKFEGIISAGKEANVYWAYGQDDTELAVKIFRINAQTSKWMSEYVRGDPRFASYRKKNTKSLITTWVMKEFKNLKRAKEAGLPCPTPMHVRENVLVMEYLGHGGTPAPKLVDVDLGSNVQHFNAVIKGVQMLLTKARLVHGDLSAYNLLYHDGRVHFIDFAQGVLVDHPNARKYLLRDIDNVLGYFSAVLPDELDRERFVASLIRGDDVSIEE